VVGADGGANRVLSLNEVGESADDEAAGGLCVARRCGCVCGLLGGGGGGEGGCGGMRRDLGLGGDALAV
jgi:hypothetical protein